MCAQPPSSSVLASSAAAGMCIESIFMSVSIKCLAARAAREDYSWERRCSIWSDAETALLLIS